jgi:hypothetical protein
VRDALGRALVVAAIAALVAACGARTATKDPAAGASASGPAASVTAPDKTRDHGVDAPGFVRMKRGACYGSCPVFTVEVRGDGRVIYDGELYVHAIGRREKTLPRAEVTKLFHALAARHLGDVRWDATCPHATDHPSVDLTLEFAGEEAHIHHDFGDSCAPNDVLRPTYALIEEAAGVGDWVKCKPIDDCGPAHP